MPTLLGNNSEINGNPRALPKSFINTNVTILYYNARSLYPKLDQLKVECLVHNPHVVCITETWLDSTIMDSELYIPDFDIVRLDRNRHGGGVIIYFRSTFICNLLFMGDVNFECIVVSLRVDFCNFYVCLLYRPPSEQQVLDTLFSTLCTLNSNVFSNFYLVGDFNIDVSNHNHPLFSKLFCITSSFLLYQVVKSFTHFNQSGNHSIIDLAFVSSPFLLNFCNTIPPLSTSDHHGFILSFRSNIVSKRPSTSTRRTVWCYAQADFDLACELLGYTDWTSLCSKAQDVNQLWSAWQSRFCSVMEQCIPQKVLPTQKHLPWLSPDLIQAIRRRNTLFRAYKRTGSFNKLVEYKRLRNILVSSIRYSKKAFLNRLHHVDPKTFWKMIKSISNQRTSIPILTCEDVEFTTDVDKAELLNKQFFSNFNHLHPSLLCNDPSLTTTDPSECPDYLLCTEDQVYNLILSLDVSKATGADNISARMLKGTVSSITLSLTKMFNLSIKTGSFPQSWKCARVVPIPKGGDLSNPTNYRPISILPILSKVLEKHVHGIISDHLLLHSPISDQQWGFTTRKSTTAAVLSMTHDCTHALDRGKEVSTVFFDISKAFDSVPHLPLLRRLAVINIDPYIRKWVHSYRIAGNFRGFQFSRKGNLQRFRGLIFADGRSRTAPPTIPG